MFKIGDKVKLKGTDEFLGYVSNIHKGDLFLREDEDFGIRVHLGNKHHVEYLARSLEHYRDE